MIFQQTDMHIVYLSIFMHCRSSGTFKQYFFLDIALLLMYNKYVA